MKRLFLLLAVLFSTLSLVAQTFEYMYEGANIRYNVVDEQNKTCAVQGFIDGGRNVIIPQKAKYNNEEYEVIAIGDYAFSECSALTSVNLPSSVTSIGERAFSGCKALTSINLPSSLTSIGNSAFSRCFALTEINLPSSVTSIGESAFFYCESLVSIELPPRIKTINNSAFEGCSALTSINLPSSVTSIGVDAFNGCKALTSINLPSSITSIEGGAFEGCSALTEINLPSSLHFIKAGAFSFCRSLVSVELPPRIIGIYDSAFKGCSALTSINLPSNMTSIGEGTFEGCSALTSINLPSSITSIGKRAFFNCKRLVSVELPPRIKTIGKEAFRYCGKLISIKLPSSLTTIEDYAFADCELESVEISSSSTSISDRVFSGCKNLTSITLHSSKPPVVSEWAFGRFTNEVVDYDKCVLYVPAGAEDAYSQADVWKKFIHIAAIGDYDHPYIVLDRTEIELSPGETVSLVVTINPENAIDKGITWRSSDESIVTVDSEGHVSAVGVGEATITFSCGEVTAECQVSVKIIPVTSITLDRTNVTSSPGESFTLSATVKPKNAKDKTLTWRSSNETVATVDAEGRVSAVSVGEATITVTCGEVSAKCLVTIIIPVTSITLDRTSTELHPGESVLLNATVEPESANNRTLTWRSSDESVVTVDSDGRVTAVGVGNAKIRVSCDRVTAECSVEVAHVEQFQYTYAGQTLTYEVCGTQEMYCIMDGSYLADDVEAVIVPDVAIDEYGNKFDVVHFTGLKERRNLRSVRLPSALTSIPDSSFCGCRSLASIVLPPSVSVIGQYAFGECSSLSTIDISQSLYSILNSAFSGCRSLSSIVLPSTVRSISNLAFDGCTSLTSINLPASITSMGWGVFRECRSLTSIELPPLIKTIGVYSFYNCVDLTSIKLPSSLTTIGSSAFGGCNSLKSVEFPSTLTSIGNQAFYNCDKLTSIKLPLSLTTIDYGAFLGCSSLVSVDIHSSLFSISDNIFGGCDNLSSVMSHSPVPPVVSDATSSINLDYNKCVLYVPAGAEDAYRQADLWKNFTHIAAIGDYEHPSVVLGRTEIELHPGENESLVVIIEPENAAEKGIVWSSSNESVVTVDAEGRLSAVGVGEATITVSCGEVSAECRIKVNPVIIPVTSITLDHVNVEFHPGESVLLTAMVEPDTATDKTLTWRSSNESVATVDAEGRVAAVGTGNATIRVSCGEITAECSVVVKPIISDVFQYTYEGLTLTYRVLDSDIMTCMMDGSYLADDVESIIIPDIAIDDYGNKFDVIGFTGLNGRISLKSVRLSSSITVIHGAAFMGCSNLTSVELPSAVTSIGNDAFNGCTSLTSINLPTSITSMGWGVFLECSSLVSVELPPLITEIRSNSFHRCVNLTTIKLPSSLITIEYSAFYGCVSLKSVEFPSTLTAIGNQAFVGCVNLTSVKLPSAFTTIDYGAFLGCSSLLSVDIPSSLTSISDEIFGGCSNLTSVTSRSPIPPVISDATFSASPDYNKCVLYVPAGAEDAYRQAEVWKKFTRIVAIGNYDHPSMLLNRTEIELHPGETESLVVTVNPENAAEKGIVWSSSNESVATVDSEGRVAAVGAGNATIKVSCGGVTAECSVIVKPIISDIFQYTSEGQTLTYRVLDSDMMTCRMEGSYLADDVESVIIPDVAIDDYGNRFDVVSFTGLGGRGRLKTVSLPSTITEIEREAFYNCVNLTSVKLPSFLETIGYRSFVGCKSLMSIELPQTLVRIEPDAFRRCTSLIAVHLPSSITSMGWCIFAECSNLALLEIPSSLTSLSGLIIDGCSNLTSIILRSSQPPVVQDDTFNGFNSYDKCVLYVPAGSENVYSQADGWKKFIHIETFEVSEAPALILNKTEIDLHQGETLPLVAIVMPENAECKTVTWASSNESVVTIDAEGRVSAVGVGEATITVSCGEVSAECRIKVNPVIIPVSSITLDRVGVELHPGEGVTLTATVEPETATDKTLAWSSSNESVATVDSEGRVAAVGAGNATIKVSCGGVTAECSVIVKPIISDIFQYTYGNQTLTYNVLDPEEMTCRMEGSYLADDVESIIIPDVAIDDYGNKFDVIGFTGLNERRNLKSVRFPSTLTVIPETAFSGCSSLTSVELPSAVTTIGTKAFNGCTSLTSINLPASVTSMGWGVFMGCSSLVSVELPPHVTTIDSYSFYNCVNLTSIKLPTSLTTIEGSAFNGCISLESVEFPLSLNSIGKYTFSNCANLTSVKLPSAFTTIDYGAFFGCSSLLSVDIPSSLTSIGDNVFARCNNLTSVTSRSPIPPVVSDAMFSGGLDYNKCILYVPAGAEDAYRQADAWKKFTHIVSESSGIASVWSDELKVYSEMSSIVMEGVPVDKTVKIFNFAGKEIWHARGDGDRLCYDHVIPGVYIVYVGTEPFKIIVH